MGRPAGEATVEVGPAVRGGSVAAVFLGVLVQRDSMRLGYARQCPPRWIEGHRGTELATDEPR